jgi:hypothetical protein
MYVYVVICLCACRRLQTTERSNILIYMTGHGGDEFLKFQDAEGNTHTHTHTHTHAYLFVYTYIFICIYIYIWQRYRAGIWRTVLRRCGRSAAIMSFSSWPTPARHTHTHTRTHTHTHRLIIK